jgi:4-diphosphocytidyl-2-C-methyl-D-erythritol kinase
MSDLSDEDRRLPNTRLVEARAKVNLSLRILGRRPDGYHDVETVIVPVSLADRIEVHADAGTGEFRTLSLSLEVLGERSVTRRIPRDESNLVLRAGAALARHAGVTGFADITLEKRVPPGAGLGGGSADAAATLRVLNDLWGCAVGVDDLVRIGAEVGSDVPALVMDQPVYAHGRGELVEPIPVISFRWSLATFPFEVSAADAFGWWDEDGGPSGPDPAAMMAAAGDGDADAVARLLSNDLEEPVIRRFPEVEAARERLLSEGARGVIMCGSGPTLAALLSPEDGRIEGGIEVTSAGGPGPT